MTKEVFYMDLKLVSYCSVWLQMTKVEHYQSFNARKLSRELQQRTAAENCNVFPRYWHPLGTVVHSCYLYCTPTFVLIAFSTGECCLRGQLRMHLERNCAVIYVMSMLEVLWWIVLISYLQFKSPVKGPYIVYLKVCISAIDHFMACRGETRQLPFDANQCKPKPVNGNAI